MQVGHLGESGFQPRVALLVEHRAKMALTRSGCRFQRSDNSVEASAGRGWVEYTASALPVRAEGGSYL